MKLPAICNLNFSRLVLEVSFILPLAKITGGTAFLMRKYCMSITKLLLVSLMDKIYYFQCRTHLLSCPLAFLALLLLNSTFFPVFQVSALHFFSNPSWNLQDVYYSIKQFKMYCSSDFPGVNICHFKNIKNRKQASFQWKFRNFRNPI